MTYSQELKTQRNILIPGSRDKPILVDLFLKENGLPKPVIIFSHGFKGFKDWGHFNAMAEEFANAGFVFVKFNFSYNATTPDDPLNFNDLEAFGENNYLTELDDLGLVIDFVSGAQIPAEQTDKNEIYLLGHSRGGGISILKAAQDNRIKRLVTWASVSGFLDRNSDETIKKWKEQGVVHTYNTRTKQNMPLKYQFYQSMQENRERLDVIRAASSLCIPFLIVHGDADDAVPISDAKEIGAACRHSRLQIIKGGDHTFGARHPHSGQLPGSAKTVISETITFMSDLRGR